MRRIDVCAYLDNFIHVSFTMASDVPTLPYHDPDALPSMWAPGPALLN